jgi:predicted DCC family thiol-disulfide oxidoreductase YuxK
MSASSAQVLLYDGLCGFCDGVVQFVIARDKHRTLRFAALQGSYAHALIARHPELRGVDSLVLVREVAGAPTTSEIVVVRSDAVVALATYLGGVWSVLGVLLRVCPRALRDWGYDRLAGVRFRIFGRRETCRIPTAEQRARFVD